MSKLKTYLHRSDLSDLIPILALGLIIGTLTSAALNAIV